jgi:murein DD-endopeptidase MepM/ murein hydrolase activator NlpD
MKKIILIIVLIFICLVGCITYSNYLIKNNSNLNLIYKNNCLQKKYKELEKRICVVESRLDSITYYNEYIYSQLFGINCADSTELELDLLDDSISNSNNLDLKILQLSNYTTNQLMKLITTSYIVKKNEKFFNSSPNIFPIKPINDTLKISSNFGWRKHPILRKILFHKGVDISSKYNTNVYSTMDGVVTKIEYSNWGYGNNITISNELGFKIKYAHLTKNIFVKKNQKILKGTLIGSVGNSGLSTAPHLHYEIYKNNIIRNPIDYIVINSKSF